MNKKTKLKTTKTPRNTIYRRFADKLYGDFGKSLYKSFDELNKIFFENKLKDKALLVGITPYGRSVGLFFPDNASIMLHICYFRQFEGIITEELKYVLLHEMMHAHLHQKGIIDNEDHGIKWAGECNRVAPLLGIKKVMYTPYKRLKLPKDEKGKRKNIYKAVLDLPKGYRYASKKELLCFPHVTLDIMSQSTK